jgi:hypothetical protein
MIDFMNPKRTTFSPAHSRRLVNWDTTPNKEDENKMDNQNIFWYPNRPKLIPPDPSNPINPAPNYINGLEESGVYIAEKKYNGDNCYIYTPSNAIWNRHKSIHRYQPTPEVLEELQKLPKNAHFNVELCNYKTKTTKNHIIVHCVMVWKGQPLLGKTWGYSRKILEDVIPDSNQHVILSPVWKTGFWNLYQEADGLEIEGIVLKNPKGLLQFSTTPIPDVNWMLKIRKPCKKYKF